jgi:hypothetical protein
VVVKLIGHSDNAPLAGRDERIYGDQVACPTRAPRRPGAAGRLAADLGDRER